MKNGIKNLITSTIISIGIALFIFCIYGSIVDIYNNGAFYLENYRFTKMIVGCIFVGLGFGIPSVVYSNDNLPMPMKVIVHMGIGFVVYTVVAYFVGWMNPSASLTQSVIMILAQLFVAFIIWLIFYNYYRKEANILNDRIKKLNK